MVEYQSGSHTLHDIKYHLVWITKYRYHVLRGEVAERARDVIREICMAREVQIIRGSLAPDHVHMLVSCPPKMAPAKLVQSIKGRSSRKLQQEFSELRRRYIGASICGRAATFARRWGRSMKRPSRLTSNPRSGRTTVARLSK